MHPKINKKLKTLSEFSNFSSNSQILKRLPEECLFFIPKEPYETILEVV